jgi:hypothetical protein
MSETLRPIPLVFWKSVAGRESAREWLNELPREDQRTIGRDIAKVQVADWIASMPPIERRIVGGPVIAAEQTRSARVLRVL